MKFGRQLAESTHPSFRNYYIAYKDLKQAIKIITGEAVPSDDLIGLSSPILELLNKQSADGLFAVSRTPESQFQELLDYELDKINSFTKVQFSVLQEEIRELVYRLTHGITGPEEESVTTALREEIVAFDEYIRLNFTGFRKALKKFDKWNKSDSSNWFLQRIVRSDFMLISIDKLLAGLSVIDNLRGKRFEPTNACDVGSVGVHACPPQFKRTKYFVPPEDLIRIESQLLKEMSVMYASPLTASVISNLSQFVDVYTRGRVGITPEIAFTESVVIFDDKRFSQYVTRRNKVTSKATLNAGYDKPVFSIRWNQWQAREMRCSIVRESHPRFADVDNKAELFQVQVKQKTLIELVTKRMSVDNFIAAEGLSPDPFTHKFLLRFVESLESLKPSAMFSYRRTLMKRDDGLYVAIDKDIKFVDLATMSFPSVFSVPLTMFQSILSQRTLTVWLSRSETQLPGFISDIVGDPAVTEVAGFSKSVHAEAVLHVVIEFDRPVSVGLPHWFLHTVSGEDSKEKITNMASMAGDEEFFSAASPVIGATSGGRFDVLPAVIGQDVSSKLLLHDIVSAKEPKQAQSVVVTPTRSHVPLLPTEAPLDGSRLDVPLLHRTAGQSKPSRSQSLFDQVKFILFGSIAPDIPEPTSKIEPKTFLANERTFLSWCYVCFMISAVAVTLVSVDPSANLEASALSLVAVVTLIWSLNVYRLRVVALRNMKSLETLLVSSNGATVVCLSVAAALGITWLGRVRQYMILQQ